MKVIFYLNTAAHQEKAYKAFAEGMHHHGITVKVNQDLTVYRPCDLLVSWSHSYFRDHLFKAHRKTGNPYLIMENGYLGDRVTKWTSMGFNGLNGTAEFCNDNSPSDRWKKYHADRLLPKRPKGPGSYVLVIGQIAQDAAVHGAPENEGPVWMHWLQAVIARIKKLTDIPVRYRPHPLFIDAVGGHDGPLFGPLEDALDGAAVVVTLSSNVGVDAILRRVPVIAMGPTSMVKPIAAHFLSTPQDLVLPYFPKKKDLLQWAYNIAYAQWTYEEVAAGEAWDHLKEYFT